jgi:hypothetical protein
MLMTSTCLQWRRALPLLVGLVVAPASAFAETILTLNQSFIEKYKDRITIDANYVIDKAHPHPNPPKADGDMHVAGHSADVGLATVAEIQNAALFPSAVALVHQQEGTGTPVRISGVWRLWPEHAGNSDQVQGKPLEPITTTNPDHIFEIHPILAIGEQDVRASLKPIDGFVEKDAEDAFTRYERTPSTISSNSARKTITVQTRMVGYNYVKFEMRLLEKPRQVQDGAFAFAAIYGADGDLLVPRRRLGFAQNTPPSEIVQGMQSGQCMLVLGIPRIDLSLVSWRVAHAKDPRGPLTWSLPYEIIVVGSYEAPHTCNENQ